MLGNQEQDPHLGVQNQSVNQSINQSINQLDGREAGEDNNVGFVKTSEICDEYHTILWNWVIRQDRHSIKWCSVHLTVEGDSKEYIIGILNTMVPMLR